MALVSWEPFLSGKDVTRDALDTFGTFVFSSAGSSLVLDPLACLFLPDTVGFAADGLVELFGEAGFLAFLEVVVVVAPVEMEDVLGGLVVGGSLSSSRTVSVKNN